MNYAIYNQSKNSYLTIVNKQSGELPDGYVFLPQENLPSDAVLEQLRIEPPNEIPLWSFRSILTLLNLDIQVDNLINSLPEPQKTVARVQWQYGNYIVRNHPLIDSLGTNLGLTKDQIDDIFIEASKLI